MMLSRSRGCEAVSAEEACYICLTALFERLHLSRAADWCSNMDPGGHELFRHVQASDGLCTVLVCSPHGCVLCNTSDTAALLAAKLTNEL